MMDVPVRIQLSRRKGWRMPPNTVKVDRTTKLGNPYLIEKRSGHQYNLVTQQWDEMWEVRHPRWVHGQVFPTKEIAACVAAARFARDIAPTLDLTDLRGKNVACWCALDATCHGDVLLELVNAPHRAEAKLEGK